MKLTDVLLQIKERYNNNEQITTDDGFSVHFFLEGMRIIFPNGFVMNFLKNTILSGGKEPLPQRSLE